MTSSPEASDPFGPSPSRPLGNPACVLFVDDEDAVRRLGARALKGAGFEVLLAADGVEAVECFRARHREISVVVMDMSMPRLGGDAAAELMHEIAPRVPVVLSSGFACDETNEHSASVVAMLQKPYRIHTLLETIARVLEQSR